MLYVMYLKRYSMAQTNKKCPYCKTLGHSGFYCKSPLKPRKEIPRTAIKKTVKAPVKKKANNKKPLMKKLEKLVKDYVKRRDEYTCQKCGKVVEGSNCHASHVIPVSRSGYLQFDPMNMKVMCYHDHINWWHKHPVEAGKWYTDTFPERWEYLQALHIQRLKPLTYDELQSKIEHYKGLLK